MHRLGEITGQLAVVAQVMERQAFARKECMLVSGPVGSGISWTLRESGMEWERQGGIALGATGVSVKSPRPLLPWLTMASPGRGVVARWDVLRTGAAEASKAVPFVGEAASYLVSEVLNFRRKKIARQTQMLGEKEQDLLFVLQTTAKDKRLLLVLDQLAYWDDDSWGLLELIASPLLHEFYPVLKSAVILAGVTPETLPRCRVLFEKLPLFECRLKRLDRSELQIALDTFSFPSMNEREMDLVYEATGGRLDLLHDFSTLSCGQETFDMSSDSNGLYGRMIERRLRALRGNVEALDRLLAAGSFLGNAFSTEEACCLAGYSIDEFRPVLQLARDEQLLNVIDGSISFKSIAMQQYFHSSRISAPTKYHEQFSECLRRLRPGDYQNRCYHLFMSDKANDALTCYCLATLDARRRRSIIPEAGELSGLNEWTEFQRFLKSMLNAYSAYDANAIEEGLSILESLETLLPDALIAERDYLEALFHLKSHRVPEYELAVLALRRWLNLQTDEPEIWSRVAQALLIALIQTDRYDEASNLEEALTKFYASRRHFGPWALFGLNCLRYRSECLHHLVPARNRLLNALAYFGPSESEALPRHPLQYYHTLTNLVSNLIANGAFAEAAVHGAQLRNLIQHHVRFPWPSLEIPANNSLLASYLAGVLPLSAALDLMRNLDDRASLLGDHLLIRNNLAVLLIHSGEIAEAQQILLVLEQALGDSADSDPYHHYFIANNLAGLLALVGSLAEARQKLADAESDLNRLYAAVRQTLIFRHPMILQELEAAATLEIARFDRILVDRYRPQCGPQWSFYGRSFLLSDIQFWASD